MAYRDRRHACAFGAEAERYDRVRPSYPAALIDDLFNLTAARPHAVLDVGCGTGRVSRLLIERGCVVLGVEPDPAMAEIARLHGVEVEVTGFEDWDSRGQRFDLVVAGQAWHWVEPEAGRAKAAAVLVPGGRLAAFWNLGRHDPAIREALHAVYERYAPELLEGATAGGSALRPDAVEDDDAELEALAADGLFERAEWRRYPWSCRYRTAEWVDLISTHSDHLVLEPDRRRSVLDGVAAALDALGGVLTVRYETTLLTAVTPAGDTAGSS